MTGSGVPSEAELNAQLRRAIAKAKRQADKMLLRGIGLVVVGVSVTVWTFMQRYYFFLILFGPVIGGFQQINASRAHRAQATLLERQAKLLDRRDL